MRLAVPVCAALALVSSQVWAVPGAVPYFGYLSAAGGAPFDGPVAVEVSLFDVSGGGTALWSEDLGSVTVSDGYLSVALGAGDPAALAAALDPAGLSTGALHLEFTIAGTVMSPRQEIGAVPYAHHADDAASLGGVEAARHVVHDGAGNVSLAGLTAGSLTVGSTAVIDATGAWIGPATGLVGPEGPQGPPGPAGSDATAASISTTAPLDLYVAPPPLGDDSNDGLSAGSPKATIVAAFAEVPPRVLHTTTIHVADGIYYEAESSVMGVIIQGRYVAEQAVLVFRGNVADPTQVVLRGSTAANPLTPARNYGFYAHSMTRIRIEGFTVERFGIHGVMYSRNSQGELWDTVLQDNGHSGFVCDGGSQCVIRRAKIYNNGDPASSGGSTFFAAGILSHMGSRSFVYDTDIGGSAGLSNGHGVHASWNAFLGCYSCRATHNLGSGYLCHLGSQCVADNSQGTGSSYSDNGQNGLDSFRLSSLGVNDSTVSNNGTHGMLLHWQATMYGAGNTGSGNADRGVYVGVGSIAQGLNSGVGGNNTNVFVETSTFALSL